MSELATKTTALDEFILSRPRLEVLLAVERVLEGQ